MTNNSKGNSESQRNNASQVFADSELEKIAKAKPGTCREKIEHIVEEGLEMAAVCLGYNLFK